MQRDLKIDDVWVGDSHPVRIMGVLNISPESFYKGSVVKSKEIAVKKAKQMVEDGADFLDIGAMSTAPGVKMISVEEELSRIIPSLKGILDEVNVPVSVDTFRAEVAEEAIKIGASIINDVSGFKEDAEMVKVICNYDLPAIIMATKDTIGDPLTIPGIIESLKSSIEQIKDVDHGNYDLKKIIIDPAIGRWVPNKTYQYNLDIIRNLEELNKLEKLVLIGVSRKSFIHEILNRPDPKDRLHGSLSATAIAVYNGAHIVRTHDVAETIDVVRIAKMIRESK